MITSAANRRCAGDVAIAVADAAGLLAPAVVRTAKIATIKAGLAYRLGTLADFERRLSSAWKTCAASA